MAETVGAVYLTAARDRAVFLAGADLEKLGEALDKLQARPTVAGPPLDVEALTRLSRAVDLDDDDGAAPAVVVLSAGEQQCLELVRHQVAVRDKLKLRLRHVCTTCGTERIENPARTADAADATRVDVSPQAVAKSVQLLTDGEPWEALGAFIAGLDVTEGQAAKQAAVCGRCDGDEFETTPITFCPGCRAVRDESILVRCPECDHDFVGRAADVALWTAVSDAMAERNRAVLRKRAGDFENGLWPKQLEALVDAVGGDEELLAMCRCARPGEVGRYVALLLTTEQLVWAWESPVSAVKSGKVRWADVRAVQEHGEQRDRYEWGVRIEIADGEPEVFTDFRGAGVGLSDTPPQFTADGLRPCMVELHQRRTSPAGHPG